MTADSTPRVDVDGDDRRGRPRLTIPHRLSEIIQRSSSLDAILDNAVKFISEEMGVDVASIYLFNADRSRLELRATEGLDPSALDRVFLEPGEGLTGKVVSEMKPRFFEDASNHPDNRYFPETREERFHSFLGVPLAIRNQPIGALVVQTRDERSYSAYEIQTLSTIAAQLVGVVENARLIEALDRGDAKAPYLDEVRRWRSSTRTTPVISADEVDIVLEGNAASRGIAIASVVVRGAQSLSPETAAQPFQGVEAELARYETALEDTRRQILEIQEAAAHEADEEHALIFSSHLLLLNDPVLDRHVRQGIEEGETAHVLVDRTLREFEQRLLAVRNPYIRERVEDLRDLHSRLLVHLLSKDAQAQGLRERIVVTQGLPPSLVVELKAEGASGLVTEFGGTTSHGALLARSMGIPAVTGVAGLSEAIRSDDVLIIDGVRGRIILRPSPETVREYEERMLELERQLTETLSFVGRKATTADGVEVEILANIAVAQDLRLAREHGAGGVGLYRTEFPFIVREQFPTREEQVRIYARAWEVFPEGPINLRLLDLGGDKFVCGGPVDVDRNPFHGYRSIRVLLDYPEILREQVQAFAIAADGRPLRILVPLVSRLSELRRTRAHIEEAFDELPATVPRGSLAIGVMVELPATVEIARPLAREVDFLSIGTNDLIQYAIAVDRENARVTTEKDPFHPAILRMVHRTVSAGRAEGTPTSVCGELAANRLMAPALVAIGVDSLSVTASIIPRLKRDLSFANIGAIRERIDTLLELGDATRVQEELESAYAK